MNPYYLGGMLVGAVYRCDRPLAHSTSGHKRLAAFQMETLLHKYNIGNYFHLLGDNRQCHFGWRHPLKHGPVIRRIWISTMSSLRG
jgi:hypothetical protein